MTKKITSLLIVLIMTLSFSAFASENRLGILSSLNIMVGYGDGNFGLDRSVTRAEFTKMAVEASKYRNSVTSRLSVSPFSDVMYDSWYAPYVYTGALNGLIKGYKDGSFKPDGLITYEEAITVALRLLGYEDSEFEYAWPYGQIGVAEKIGICDNMDSYAGQNQSRGQVSHLFYNLLKTTPKNGSGDYVKTIGHEILSDVVLISSNNETQSVQKGYVFTSEGMFKVGDSFDYSLIGLRGDAILKDGRIDAFIPNSQNKIIYSIFSSAGDNYTLLRGGEISDYKLDKDDTLYCETQKTSVGAMMGQFEPGDTLELYFDKDMREDYIVYKKGKFEGPFAVTSSSWINDYGISPDALVIRKGNKVSPAEVKTNDILYYSATLNVVWAYCNTVVGVYESAEPNQNTPKTITVSGKTYSIEGTGAYNALSSGGTFSYGDTVTLLLGKDGDVAGVVTPYEEKRETVGFVVETGTKKGVTVSGEKYSSDYISIVGTDGVLQQYESARDYSSDRYQNSVVRLKFSGGKATASVLKSANSISGTYSYSKKQLGLYTLSADSEILDVITATETESPRWKKVYPQRLDGVSISERDVLYAEITQDNTIKRLILNDVTGDAYTYGIVTGATSNSMFTSGEYKYFEGPSKYETSTMGMAFSVYAGQSVQIRKNAANVVSRLKPLQEYGRVTSLDKTRAAVGNNSYLLSDEICVYTSDEPYGYQAMALSELCDNADAYNITAYYDKTERSGGRIRVLLAKPKTS